MCTFDTIIMLIYIIFLFADTHFYIVYVVMGIYVLLLPIWIYVVLRNKYTCTILTTGWTPVLSALFISG